MRLHRHLSVLILCLVCSLSLSVFLIFADVVYAFLAFELLSIQSSSLLLLKSSSLLLLALVSTTYVCFAVKTTNI